MIQLDEYFSSELKPPSNSGKHLENITIPTKKRICGNSDSPSREALVVTGIIYNPSGGDIYRIILVVTSDLLRIQGIFPDALEWKWQFKNANLLSPGWIRHVDLAGILAKGPEIRWFPHFRSFCTPVNRAPEKWWERKTSRLPLPGSGNFSRENSLLNFRSCNLTEV